MRSPEDSAVTQYMPFVRQTARAFGGKGVSEDDLVQVGALAVALAFRKWRPDGGANMLSWIRRPVRNAMSLLVREQRRAGGTTRGGPAGRDYMEAQLSSLDATEPGELSMHETVGTVEDPPDCLALALLPAAVSALTSTERAVIRGRYHQGLTVWETARSLGLQQDDCARAEASALKKLRDGMMGEEDV